MNIVLTGYRCSGKTTVGEILAGNLGRRFADTDRMIEERVGKSIHGFVSVKGWEKFRELEQEIVADISFKDNMVISTGGGVVTVPENVANLRRNGWLVWLHAAPETIVERMKRDDLAGEVRPSLTGRGALNEIGEILQERSEWYAMASDLRLDTDDVSPAEVAETILMKLCTEPGKG